MNDIKVGDIAVHVERFLSGRIQREIARVKVIRETKTQWVDANGTHWRKSDGAMVPQYVCPRSLMSVAAFEAEAKR